MNRTRTNPEWITAFDWGREDAMRQAQVLLATGVIPTLARRPFVGDAAPDVVRFGRYVAALRHSSGWGRPELARRMGIDPLAVLLLERAELAREELSEALVGRVAQAFAIPREELVLVPAGASAPAAAAPVRRPLLRWAEVLDAVRSLLVPAQTGVAWGGQGRMARGSTPGDVADAADGLVLGGPTPPVALAAALADGLAVRVLLTVEPLTFPEPDACTLRVEVRDGQGEPLAGILLETELDGVPYYVEAATDAAGVARFERVPLEDLPRDEPPPLRLTRTS